MNAFWGWRDWKLLAADIYFKNYITVRVPNFRLDADGNIYVT